jgi:uncharacterized C2H2 Zn-finger protein
MTNSAIRGSRVGAGPTGERGRIAQAEKITVEYFCINGHEMAPMFAASVAKEDIPEFLDCVKCGLPAGQDKDNIPEVSKNEPYKTHLAYVKERRSEEEAKALLQEAIDAIHQRRARAADSNKG